MNERRMIEYLDRMLETLVRIEKRQSDASTPIKVRVYGSTAEKEREGLARHRRELSDLRDRIDALSEPEAPEPKPWHSAKSREIWVVTIRGVEHVVKVVSPHGGTYHDATEVAFLSIDGTPDWVHRASVLITAGRRIWPEAVAS